MLHERYVDIGVYEMFMYRKCNVVYGLLCIV